MKNVLYSASIATLLLSLLAFAIGCSNDMNAGQYTFACDDQNPCAEGFFCGAEGVCVEDGTDVSEPSDATDSTEDVTEDTTDTEQDTSDTADSAQDADDDTDACATQTWYRDCDDDGYAGVTTEACERPRTAGGDCPIDGGDPEQRWKSESEIADTSEPDCDDNDPRAFPGQTDFFGTEREEVGGYDFDCDGDETREYTSVSTGCEEADSCGLQLGKSTCNPTANVVGWQNSLAGCGEESPWVTGCSDECVRNCNEARTTTSQVQTCR